MLSTTKHTYRLLALLLLVLSLSVSAARAQGSANLTLSPEDRERSLNGPQKNFFFQVDDQKEFVDAGFFGQRLRPYVARNPEALDNLNAYRRQKWLFVGERALFLTALGVYSQQVLAKDEQQYFSRVQQGAIGVAAVSLLANVLITRNTNGHFRRAIDANNAALPSAHAGSWQRTLPTSVGVAALGGKPQLVLSWSLQ